MLPRRILREFCAPPLGRALNIGSRIAQSEACQKAAWKDHKETCKYWHSSQPRAFQQRRFLERRARGRSSRSESPSTTTRS